MPRERPRFAAHEKLAILRRHLLEKVPVSDLCDQFQLRPTVFYRWQKRFFENGTAALEDGDEAREGWGSVRGGVVHAAAHCSHP
ncbi:MAG: transposase [Planctomycetes bacterium]|nr:transposase [Planctomycetota bacterium]